MKIEQASDWSKQLFGLCNLGDKRRLDRLIAYSAEQADDPAGSTNKVANGSSAAAEGSYRFLRNDEVFPTDIDAGAFESVARQCDGRRTILCIQDTSSVEVAHKALRDIIAEPGCPTGFLVHSTLCIDGDTGEIIGLIDQERWLRSPNRKKDKKGPHDSKESDKWAEADERVQNRLENPDIMITVCDREADIYEYIVGKVDRNERFIVRAKVDRETSTDNSLWVEMETAPSLGSKIIEISQRGPCYENRKTRRLRKARKSTLDIRSKKVLIAPPSTVQSDGSLVELNYVYVVELNPSEGSEPLKWRLLTTEPIDTLENALQIVHYYEQRWTIEEFHKCWKTGCRAEERPFQSFEAVERFLAISCHIGVRILQLHRLARLSPDRSCASVLNDDELSCLQAMSSIPLTAQEALLAIAKLGEWRDTKNTGRIGWQAIWIGWIRFQERLMGWRLAKQVFEIDQQMHI